MLTGWQETHRSGKRFSCRLAVRLYNLTESCIKNRSGLFFAGKKHPDWEIQNAICPLCCGDLGLSWVYTLCSERWENRNMQHTNTPLKSIRSHVRSFAFFTISSEKLLVELCSFCELKQSLFVHVFQRRPKLCQIGDVITIKGDSPGRHAIRLVPQPEKPCWSLKHD